jgi:signal transduction histidine kinase
VKTELLATKLVQVDSYRIEQVLVNLLNNSTKFGAGRPIHIKSQDTSQGIEILIRDHGQGISSEYIDKIFDKFERAGQDSGISGLGLGLFISKQIVLSHRGSLHARSGIDAGAEFVLTLPTGE